MTDQSIISESAVRGRANTRGYRVCKSRQRSTHCDNYGEFMLIDCYRNAVVLGSRFDATLEEIADYLKEQRVG
jgi:hypothetical protein